MVLFPPPLLSDPPFFARVLFLLPYPPPLFTPATQATVDYQQIANGNITNQIHGYYGKFILSNDSRWSLL